MDSLASNFQMPTQFLRGQLITKANSTNSNVQQTSPTINKLKCSIAQFELLRKKTISLD